MQPLGGAILCSVMQGVPPGRALVKPLWAKSIDKRELAKPEQGLKEEFVRYTLEVKKRIRVMSLKLEADGEMFGVVSG